MLLPTCPRCRDGGVVEVMEVRIAEGNVFQPLPRLPPVVKVFRCRCGWMQLASEGGTPDTVEDEARTQESPAG